MSQKERPTKRAKVKEEPPAVVSSSAVKKEEGEASTIPSLQRDEKGVAFFELSSKRRVMARSWKGNILIDIREVRIRRKKLPCVVSLTFWPVIGLRERRQDSSGEKRHFVEQTAIRGTSRHHQGRGIGWGDLKLEEQKLNYLADFELQSIVLTVDFLVRAPTSNLRAYRVRQDKDLESHRVDHAPRRPTHQKGQGQGRGPTVVSSSAVKNEGDDDEDEAYSASH